MPYRAVEKHHSFQLRDPTSLIGSFNYKRISTKTQDGCNYLLPTIDSPMESLDALTRYGKIRPHDFDTPNVTRKVDTFSLNTQHNANSFTLLKIATKFPSKTSLMVALAPWPFTVSPILREIMTDYLMARYS